MKLGTLIVSTNAFSRSSLGYTVSQLEAAGIRRISLWGGAAHGFSGYPGSSQADELRQLMRQHRMELIEFAPEVLSYPFNPADDRAEVRRRTAAYYKACAAFCARVEIPRLLLHPGTQLLDRSFPQALHQAAGVLREACAHPPFEQLAVFRAAQLGACDGRASERVAQLICGYLQ